MAKILLDRRMEVYCGAEIARDTEAASLGVVFRLPALVSPQTLASTRSHYRGSSFTSTKDRVVQGQPEI